MGEQERLNALTGKKNPWKQWGPYLSERQWGTVREDYSEKGEVWTYFSHDQARSRAYRWGEDGIAGISDNKQRLCFACAFWNGQDPIIKERLFGLTNLEGNHGEDVKEYYYYLDNTPTHSYMKYLYKYPQQAYPYVKLVEENKKLGFLQSEYELLDTGIFDDNAYFDVFIEYAKETPDTLLVRITVHNRGSESAPIHLLPSLWFRNTWQCRDNEIQPLIKLISQTPGMLHLSATCDVLGERFLSAEGQAEALFTENETNNQKLFGTPNTSAFVKDGIDEYLVHRQEDAINPAKEGTKAAIYFKASINPHECQTFKLRLSNEMPTKEWCGETFDQLFAERIKEADQFYHPLLHHLEADAAQVMRQALSGMLWSKQYYLFEVHRWLDEHGANPFQLNSKDVRNKEWFHMVNDHIISVPDKWEYPWYAAWDLAFHATTYALVDLEFSKRQLMLMLKEIYQHPSGQMPAYEWNFSEVNPPVHAWAALYINGTGKVLHHLSDPEFLKRVYSKLLINFTWWVNRKDRHGKNVFEGGFLGLDNIGVFDRSAPLPTGGYLEQADGTAWMAFFCQNMLEMSMELAAQDSMYEELTLKFAEHFLWIAAAVNKVGDEGMWDEEDGFYYDVLRLPDGTAKRLKVRSLVGLLPMCATTVIEDAQRRNVPKAMLHLSERAKQMPDLLNNIHPTGHGHLGYADRGIIALVNRDKLRRILTVMLSENEFFSPHGIRSLSRYHLDHPYVFNVEGKDHVVNYLPAESDSGMFGGNSNWRGPVWLPINCLLIRSLLNYYLYYGDDFKIECPTGSGKMMNLFDVSHEIANRLVSLFTRDVQGRRPVFGDSDKMQNDPFWKDHLLFYEYFNGEDGTGLGASHQTGWTGLIANLLYTFKTLDAASFLKLGKAGFAKHVAVLDEH